MKKHALFLLIMLACIFSPACAQPISPQSATPKVRTVSDGCEGCEALYEGKAFAAEIELPDWHEQGTKIEISGTVYEVDGKTPAPHVILYVYHTDQQGLYDNKGITTGWQRRHGYIRGWLKTDAEGNYRIRTLRPAVYPNSNIPAHIHFTVKEPNTNAYYIDDIEFEDDPFLTSQQRQNREQRGGSGIMKLEKDSSLLFKARRDIILGKNIPNYTSDK